MTRTTGRQGIHLPVRRSTTHGISDSGQSDLPRHEEVDLKLANEPHFDCESVLDQMLSLGTWKRASTSNNREILCRRFGLVSGKSETLEAIGTDLGITRERVRQIQQKALGYIRRRIHKVDLHRSFICQVTQEIARRGGAITKEDMLEFVGHETLGIHYNLEMSLAFILHFSPFLIDLPKSAEDRWVVYGSERQSSRLESTANRISAHLLENGPSQRDHLISIAASNGIDADAVNASIVVYAMSTDDDGYVWLANPPRWHLVLAGLRQLGKPAHFTDITRRVNSNLGADEVMTERAVHATLGAREPRIFRRVGIGTFGLAEWGLPAAKHSVDLVCRILEGEFNWMTFQEIAIKARALGWQAKPQSIKMALDLEDQKPSRRVRSVGPNTSARYGLSWWNDPTM